MASKKALAHLKDREGVKYESYLDSLKKPTAGVGHLLSVDEQKIYPIGTKIPEAQVNKWLKEDLAKAETAAKTQADQMRAKGLAVDPNFEESLISVNFQLGTGWTKKFPSAWKNLQSGDYEGAISQIQFADPNKKPGVKSSWANQTPVRVNDFTQAIQAQADYKKAPKNAPGVNSYEQYMQAAENENAALMPNFGAPKVEAAPEVRPNFKVAGGYNPNKAAENVMSQYGKGPREVIKETETITEEGPGFIDRFTSGFKELYPFNEGGPVEQQIRTENINVSEPDMYRNYRMQEAARRSMMQGNEEERMADYEDALFQSGIGGMAGNSYYPARIIEPTPPPMQAAQRMMGGGMGYAQGGTVDQAQGLASLGRGGDSTLVHMQPREVAGLQQLAQSNGTSLTRNPMTGYPEAFSLGGVLKAAAPIPVGAMMPGFGTAIAAGALTGGTIAAATGDDVLAGAVSGGFGGASGSGFGEAFAGVPEAATATGTATSNMGQQMAADAAYTASQGMAQTLATPASFAAPSSIANPLAGAAPIQGAAPGTFTGSVGQGVDVASTSMMTPQASMNPFKADALSGTSPAGRMYNKAASNLGTPGVDKYSEVVSEVKGKPELTSFAPPRAAKPADAFQMARTFGAPVASLGLGGLEESDFINKPDFNDPRDKYDPRSKLNLSRDTGISEAMSRDTGLRLLARGGYLQGPGDGMSDDIPATINGDEPAALADGEFVIPADVVSHIGNGSSEAGSKQLYAMMNRIRKARTGRESQGKEIKPGKYMPR